MISFTVPGEPVPLLRPRVVRKGKFVHTYTPKKCQDHKELVRLQTVKLMRVAWGRVVPERGPVVFGVRFYFSRPKTVKREDHSVRPDLSNCLKLVEDALDGVVWKDDGQVVGYLGYPFTGKFYAARPQEARTEVLVIPLEELYTVETIGMLRGLLQKIRSVQGEAGAQGLYDQHSRIREGPESALPVTVVG